MTSSILDVLSLKLKKNVLPNRVSVQLLYRPDAALEAELFQDRNVISHVVSFGEHNMLVTCWVLG